MTLRVRPLTSRHVQLRLVLAGLPPLPSECTLHPGRRVCNVDGLLAAAGVPVPTAEE